MKWLERTTLDRRAVTELWDGAQVRCYGFYERLAGGRFRVERARQALENENMARWAVVARALVRLAHEQRDLEAEGRRLVEGETKCSTENLVEQSRKERT
jgi:hypothetical protein